MEAQITESLLAKQNSQRVFDFWLMPGHALAISSIGGMMQQMEHWGSDRTDGTSVFLSIYVCISMYVFMYIYICIYRNRNMNICLHVSLGFKKINTILKSLKIWDKN